MASNAIVTYSLIVENEVCIILLIQKSVDIVKNMILFICTGSAIKFSTPDVLQYSTIWRTADGETDIIFRVKSCNNAHIALSERFGTTNEDTYEIIIGSNNNMR